MARTPKHMDIPIGKVTHRNPKSRGNYPSAGWCGRTDCRWWGGARCARCVRWSEYEPRGV
ncbi:MAG TPA: hypothetical protein VM223_11770 [Planctomycetota bacterium]|nr:hypothetical protein [Planctomycetota bacterium]